KGIFIDISKNIFKDDNLKETDTLSISNIKDEFSSIKNKFEELELFTGKYNLIFTYVATKKDYFILRLVLDNYFRYPDILAILKPFDEFDIIAGAISIPTNIVESYNKFQDLVILDNQLVSKNHNINSLIIFDIYGR